MRRLERGEPATAMFAVGRIATLASPSADRASISVSLSSAILPVSGVVAILGVLVLLLMRPVAISASGAAGHTTKLDSHAALGGQEEH
jgi:hypothetical protein